MEKEIARWVRAKENRSGMEAEIESEEPMEMGGDASCSKDEGGWYVITTSVEHHEPMATSASSGRDAERHGDILVSRKHVVSSDAIVKLEAKWTRSPRPLEASLALPPPAPGTAVGGAGSHPRIFRVGVCT